MEKEEIYRFLKENPFFALATSEGSCPHVRILMLHKADETGIYFMTGKFKDVYRQLSVNPQTELCFSDRERQVRISGMVENLDKDLNIKKEIADSRGFLKPWIDKYGFKYMGVFRLKNGIATSWSLETEAEPKSFISL